MATKKSKKNIKVRDLKPKKDAKGGRTVLQSAQQGTGLSKTSLDSTRLN